MRFRCVLRANTKDIIHLNEQCDLCWSGDLSGGFIIVLFLVASLCWAVAWPFASYVRITIYFLNTVTSLVVRSSCLPIFRCIGCSKWRCRFHWMTFDANGTQHIRTHTVDHCPLHANVLCIEWMNFYESFCSSDSISSKTEYRHNHRANLKMCHGGNSNSFDLSPTFHPSIPCTHTAETNLTANWECVEGMRRNFRIYGCKSHAFMHTFDNHCLCVNKKNTPQRESHCTMYLSACTQTSSHIH